MLDVLCLKCIFDISFHVSFLSISLGKWVEPSFVKDTFQLRLFLKWVRWKNGPLTYSCYLHIINLKLPFDICKYISLFSKANVICKGVWMCMSHKGKKKKKRIIICSQSLGPSMFLLDSLISRHIDFYSFIFNIRIYFKVKAGLWLLPNQLCSQL